MSKEEWLSKLTAGLIVYDHRNLITTAFDTSIEQALAIMKYHGITCIIVKQPDSQEFAGIVTLVDIAVYVVGTTQDETTCNPAVPDCCPMASLTGPIGDLIGVTEEGKKLWQYDTTTPLDVIIDCMSKGVHRVLIHGREEDGQSDEWRLLTQSDIMNFLLEFSRHVPELVKLTQSTLREAGLVSDKKGVHTVSSDMTAIQAFRQMSIHETSAAPIVDKTGHIVGTLSTSDLRGLQSSKMSQLFEPVMSYLHKRSAIHFPVCVSENAAVGQVMNLVTAKKIHRVWVVDKDLKLVGVVSLSDCIAKFSPYDWLRSSD